MGRVIIFCLQVAAVIALTVLHYMMDSFNRYYFPKEPQTIASDATFAAMVSLIWLAPGIAKWAMERLKGTA